MRSKFATIEDARAAVVEVIASREGVVDVEAEFDIDAITNSVVWPSDFGGFWIPNLKYGQYGQFWITALIRRRKATA